MCVCVCVCVCVGVGISPYCSSVERVSPGGSG